MSWKSLLTLQLALLLSSISQARAAVTVNSTILVIARESNATFSGTSLLQGYGIPFSVLDLSQKGATLPTLNTSANAGNYGGIVINSLRDYSKSDDGHNILSDIQWQQLYAYQAAFGVRMVRLNAFPSAEFGTQSLSDNSVQVDQPVSITDVSAFSTANIVSGAQMSTAGTNHYPAKITNSSIAVEIAQFAAISGQAKGTAAVVNKIGNREQQVWFLQFATDFSSTSNLLSHAWIHWMTRGIYLGFRRIYLNTQVDDIFLETEIYKSNKNFRLVGADLDEHIAWTKDINSKMPAGSNYVIELGHNGNGNIEAATDTDSNNNSPICNPLEGVEYATQPDGFQEYIKPIGTGKSIWPTKFKNYTWSYECTQLDPLAVWFSKKSNLNAYFHISHTFTHEEETNATYSDVFKEISWNQAWLKQQGIDAGTNFSPNGIIPPSISGLHNGDALRAWVENGIRNVVGDNSRPVLMERPGRANDFWPLASNVQDNGYAGVTIMGRYSSSIYYNCDLPDCVTAEWIAIAGGKGNFQSLIDYEKSANMPHLLGLHWDPYMFHQANMRVSDTSSITVNGVTKKYSLLMAWTETMVNELTRLTTWPIITLKHDDLAVQWLARKARDQCIPNMSYQLSDNRKSITGIVVSAADTKCSTAIPVTFPGTVKNLVSATKEQVGSDPATLWITLGGAPQSYSFANEVVF
ncbi:hypothetical protein G7Y89_g8665 [Cudoniella acicularis]|uniref:Extracellular serine-rich protein n=1 Tax=Cudoniella acicularis TaxID=354080 RepID=A0A8H4W0W1_9HELO|nr:hypothetical protein G7Y89_g8665 [Cudoniella acicularis]